MVKILFFALLNALPLWGAAATPAAAAKGYFVYVADYSQTASHGIYAYRFDTATGNLTAMGKMADVASPSFIATDPQHRFLYVATDQDEDPKKTGSLSSFSIDPRSGHLTLLNRVEVDGDPCHLAVDQTSTILFAANYNSGTVVSFALEPDGRIGVKTGFVQQTGSGPNHARQAGPHAHEVVLSPDNRFLFVPNLGADQISSYRVDLAKRSFVANDPAFVAVTPGLGPRHLVFSPDGRFAYAVCEMGSSVVTFSYDAARGALTPLQTISTVPPGFHDVNASAEIQIDREGKYLYASNRGDDSIAVFAIDAESGRLRKVQIASSLGKIPRNFVLDPSGKYVLVGNQLSDAVAVLGLEPGKGSLKPVAVSRSIHNPVCILFVPVG